MNSANVTILQKTRSMCLLYGVLCLTVGLVIFSVLQSDEGIGLAMIMASIAIFGFWRIAHKMKRVLATENA